MAVFQIPTDNTLPWYTFRIVLSNITYTLQLRYNTRMDRWFMQIQDAVGNPIVSGLPLLQRYSPLLQYRTLAVPAGDILIYNNTGTLNPPGLASFLSDYSIIYVDPSQ